MSLTTVAEVRALVETDLEDEDLQDVIEREEAWLARRIGKLAGPRTVVYYPDPYGPIRLSRPTTSVVVTDSGVTVTPTLTEDGLHLYDFNRLWAGTVTVTLTPADELEVKRAVISLISLAVAPDVSAETMGSYSYQRFGSAGASASNRPSRGAIVRSLRPYVGPASVPMVARG